MEIWHRIWVSSEPPKKRAFGSSLDDILREEGLLEEARAIAIKDAVAFQVQKAMEIEHISKVEMARRMKTSRAALDRFWLLGIPPSLCKR